MKNILAILGVVLIFICIISVYNWIKKGDEVDQLKKDISVYLMQRDSLEQNILGLSEELAKKNVSQVKTEKKIDSLQALIDASTNKPCEHQLLLYKEQNGELKTGLRKCNEAKAIQAKVINTYQGLVINHEVTCPDQIKLVKTQCEQKGKVWKWIAAGGWLVALIVIL